MSPTEFVKMATKLKELGATKVAATEAGDFEVTFAGPARVVALPAQPEREHDRVRELEPVPEVSDARQAYRDSVWRKVTGGG